ncbi:hypothetical protein F5888DRAFT_1750959 [Russula emetica]|nr:hypothetical protein F5888DRAFT_1750959 [Russula emetica]
MKTADQEDAALPVFPFSFFFSWLWLYAGLLSLSAGKRISDVMVDNGIDDDCISISSPSSQRSIITEDNKPLQSDGALAFAGAVQWGWWWWWLA